MFFGFTSTIQSWRVVGLSPIIELRLHIFNYDKFLIIDIYSKEHKRPARRVAVSMWVL